VCECQVIWLDEDPVCTVQVDNLTEAWLYILLCLRLVFSLENHLSLAFYLFCATETSQEVTDAQNELPTHWTSNTVFNRIFSSSTLRPKEQELKNVLAAYLNQVVVWAVEIFIQFNYQTSEKRWKLSFRFCDLRFCSLLQTYWKWNECSVEANKYIVRTVYMSNYHTYIIH
jgi:hypothetical protein